VGKLGNSFKAHPMSRRLPSPTNRVGRFRTVWMPENAWGDFAIVLRDDGFTVKGNYYRGGTREDR
jgi:hypothetical protein